MSAEGRGGADSLVPHSDVHRPVYQRISLFGRHDRWSSTAHLFEFAGQFHLIEIHVNGFGGMVARWRPRRRRTTGQRSLHCLRPSRTGGRSFGRGLYHPRLGVFHDRRNRGLLLHFGCSVETGGDLFETGNVYAERTNVYTSKEPTPADTLRLTTTFFTSISLFLLERN